MDLLMLFAGRTAGILGVLLCLVAGISRLTGSFYVADIQATTVFMVGTGLMVFSCLLRLESLVNRA